MKRPIGFKDSLAGEEISTHQAIASVEDLVDRKLLPFEFNLLMARPVDGSTSITVVSMLVADPSENNPLRSARRAIIGYVVRRRENAGRYNYNDVVGTDAFYLPDGRLIGLIKLTIKDEPGLVAPLIDPIDLAGGELAGLVRIGAKALMKAGAEVVASSFRDAMVLVERNLLARGAKAEASALRTISEEELAMAFGRGVPTRPLSSREVDEAIGLLRNGADVHVESMGQMRQIQGELGQVGVRSESSSSLIPQRKAASTIGEEVKPELSGSYKAGPGTYRVDPAHGPGKVPYSSHNEYPHINITLRNGKKLAIIVTGSKSF